MKCNWTFRSGLTWFYIGNELALKNEEKEDELCKLREIDELCERVMICLT